MQRRWRWSILGILILAVFVVQPQSAAAMPAPGAIRALQFYSHFRSDVLRVASFFHDPCDIGSGVSYNDAEGDHVCTGQNKIFRLDISQDVAAGVNIINTRYSGQSIAYTVAVWLKPNTEWHPTGAETTLFADYPLYSRSSWLPSQRIDTNFSIIYSLIDPKNGASGVAIEMPDPGGSGRLGQGYYASQASGDNTDRPDLILTILYKNLPEPILVNLPVTLSSTGTIYYPTNIWNNLGSASSSFILRPRDRKQTISVDTGDIFIGNAFNERLLPNDNQYGQTLVTRDVSITNENKCSWMAEPQRSNECPFDHLTQIGAYLFNNSTANASTSGQLAGLSQGAGRDALRNAINKAAQESAQIVTDSNLSNIQTAIRNFLTAPQEKWKYPAGQMLIVSSQVAGDVTGSSNIAVTGRKVVVFAGGGNAQFFGTVTASQPNQVAFIGLGQSVLSLFGPTASEPGGDNPRYDGAYVALDVTRDAAGNFTDSSEIDIQSRGQSHTLTIRGLIAANKIDVYRNVVSGDDSLVKIIYDPSFAQSNLIGLSSLIRPLASGAK